MNEQSMTQQSYRRELERNRIARLKRELRLKEEEQRAALEKQMVSYLNCMQHTVCYILYIFSMLYTVCNIDYIMW